MSERKWTPPSWQSWEYHSGYYQALHDSAAPELYEALEEISEWSRRQNIALPSPKIYAALAKARGER